MLDISGGGLLGGSGVDDAFGLGERDGVGVDVGVGVGVKVADGEGLGEGLGLGLSGPCEGSGFCDGWFWAPLTCCKARWGLFFAHAGRTENQKGNRIR